MLKQYERIEVICVKYQLLIDNYPDDEELLKKMWDFELRVMDPGED